MYDADEQSELQTQAECILTLIAICGELPKTALLRLSGGEAYKQKVIKQLKKNKQIKTFYKDGVRGYRLLGRAKEKLLHEHYDRFSFYLTGVCETSHLRSETARRMRLLRLAETTVTMINAKVEVLRDKKANLFMPIWEKREVSVPAFYSSREIKEIGIDSTKFRGSRAMGVMLGNDTVFTVYNFGDALTRWEYRSEMRFKTMMTNLLCHERLSHLYSSESVSGLLLANTISLMGDIFTQPRKNTYFLFEGGYEHFYFLTNDRKGERLLMLLHDAEWRAALDELLADGLAPANPTFAIENDALDADGNPVLFGYTCDLPRLRRFDVAIRAYERKGTVICFDFQKEMLSNVLNKTIHFQTIDFEKWERSFFEES